MTGTSLGGAGRGGQRDRQRQRWMTVDGGSQDGEVFLGIMGWAGMGMGWAGMGWDGTAVLPPAILLELPSGHWWNVLHITLVSSELGSAQSVSAISHQPSAIRHQQSHIVLPRFQQLHSPMLYAPIMACRPTVEEH